MSLRCKPNDLCRVLQGPHRDHYVTVVNATPVADHEGWWQWTYEPPELRHTDDSTQMTWYDHVLEPVRDPGPEAVDQMVRLLGSPVDAVV